MKKITVFLASLLFSVVSFGATFNLFTPATGVLKGNASTYVTTAALSSDIYALWTGTCNNTTYLRGDGSCATPPGTGGGTVNSVALSAPSVFGISGSPVTSTGTLALTFASGQTANSFLATPDGTTGALSLRTILNGDLPTVNVAHGGTGAVTLTGYVKGTGTTAMTASATVPVADISGTLPVANGGTGVTSSTGSGSNVLSISPTLVTPLLGTPISGTMTNVTGLPLTTGVTGTLPVTNGGTGVTTLTGIAKGNGTSAFSVAASGDVIATWGGTCSASTYLRGDGSCQTPATGGTSANPSATIGLTAVNGAASTYMRSDGAPALSQAIVPTWSGAHTFQQAITVTATNTQAVRLSGTLSGNQANSVWLGPSLTSGGSGGVVWYNNSGSPYLALETYAQSVPIHISSAGTIIDAPSSGTALTVNATSASTAGIDLASGHLKIGGSAGTAGQVLTSGGSSAAPSWTDVAATSTGSFTATMTGMTSATTQTMNYRVVSGMATLWLQSGNLSGTSNTTDMTLTGLPAAVQPAHTKAAIATGLVNSGSKYLGYANVSTSTITFELCNGTCSGTGFTNSGSKGLNNSWTVTYSLD